MNQPFTPSEALLNLRARIDQHDQKLARMLCERLQLIMQAAPLKPRFEDVRLEERIEEIIEKVSPVADEYQIDRAYLETIYRLMMDESITREGERWKQLHQND